MFASKLQREVAAKVAVKLRAEVQLAKTSTNGITLGEIIDRVKPFYPQSKARSQFQSEQVSPL